MSRFITVATCNLNQWALDWVSQSVSFWRYVLTKGQEGNTNRIIESIHKAKDAGARLRVGPELEIPGYGCLDHFLEMDVYANSFDMLERILRDETCHNIILDIGLPILHRNLRFNCRVLALNGKILFIRPKLLLANDGNYREMRYFTPWMRQQHIEDFYLPKNLAKLQGSTMVPIGDCVLSTPDTTIGVETWYVNKVELQILIDAASFWMIY